jgi:hypothetical protein
MAITNYEDLDTDLKPGDRVDMGTSWVVPDLTQPRPEITLDGLPLTEVDDHDPNLEVAAHSLLDLLESGHAEAAAEVLTDPGYQGQLEPEEVLEVAEEIDPDIEHKLVA